MSLFIRVRPVGRALAAALLMTAPVASRAQTGGTAQTIDTVRESAMENSAVTVLGRVETIDRSNNVFTLSDDTGEIDVSTVTPADTLQEGQQVRVSGTVSAPATGEKNIVATSIDVIGHGESVSEGRKGSHRAREPR